MFISKLGGFYVWGWNRLIENQLVVIIVNLKEREINEELYKPGYYIKNLLNQEKVDAVNRQLYLHQMFVPKKTSFVPVLEKK